MMFSSTQPSQAMGCIALAALLFIAVGAYAQTFETIASFNGPDGANPYYGSLAQGTDGNFYGMTVLGGASSGDNNGTVFKLTPAGTLTSLHSFCANGTNCTEGRLPYSGLILGADGNFYGMASRGGENNAGTVFEIASDGTLSVLHRFCADFNNFCLDGEFPETTLVLANDGELYGTTSEGGSDIGNYGESFAITSTGAFTKLHGFCIQPSCLDGNIPSTLIQASDGNFYGTTSGGGFEEGGTIFEMRPTGAVATLYTFCPQSDCTGGSRPLAGLVQASDGNFYGTAVTGGNTNCTQGCGTIFKITPGGQYTSLHSFCSLASCPDGSNPFAGLIQATDGNLYGVTSGGGANGAGTIFKITLSGEITILHTFCTQANCSDGAGPLGALVQSTNGAFYGTTVAGGKSTNCIGGCGTVFSLSTGLAPFVQTVPVSAKVKTAIIILGNNLTGSTNVIFNGVAAAFTVASDTEIKAVVPGGATTGSVQVFTPNGTLTSNIPFRIE